MFSFQRRSFNYPEASLCDKCKRGEHWLDVGRFHLAELIGGREVDLLKDLRVGGIGGMVGDHDSIGYFFTLKCSGELFLIPRFASLGRGGRDIIILDITEVSCEIFSF